MKASRQQQKKFFALCSEGNWDKKRAEEHAVKRYHLRDFSEISSAQISPLIDAMEKRLRESSEKESRNNAIHARIYDTFSGRMLYSRFAKVGHDEGLIMYFPLSYETNRVVEDETEIDVMVGSGKFDEKGREIYRYDIVKDNEESIYLVDFDQDLLQWIMTSMETDTAIPLYQLKKGRIIGSVYEEVEE